jgi:hypothetical protein
LGQTGGMSLEETNELEKLFLEMLDFDINITEYEYQSY